MGIEEKNEWLLDLVIEEFSNLTGMYGGIDSDVVVYSKNSTILFSHVCVRLRLRAKPLRAVLTLGDFAHHFLWLLEEKERQYQAFCLKVQNSVRDLTGKTYALNEPVFGDLEPTSTDEAQYLREEIHQALKLGKLKNKLVSLYGGHYREEAMFKAKTICDFANVFFWPYYKAS